MKYKNKNIRCTIDDEVVSDRFEELLHNDYDTLYINYKRSKKNICTQQEFKREIRAIKKKVVDALSNLCLLEKDDIQNIIKVNGDE